MTELTQETLDRIWGELEKVGRDKIISDFDDGRGIGKWSFPEAMEIIKAELEPIIAVKVLEDIKKEAESFIGYSHTHHGVGMDLINSVLQAHKLAKAKLSKGEG